MAMISSGTLMRNTEPHQKCSTRKPEMGGPNAAPPAAMPAQTAIALGRSSGGNTLTSNDRVEGMTKAAAPPITARAAMTWPAVSASDAATAPTRNSTMPPCRARRRPNRSPSVPAVNSSPANTRL
jgi:hypothetical protein